MVFSESGRRQRECERKCNTNLNQSFFCCFGLLLWLTRPLTELLILNLCVSSSSPMFVLHGRSSLITQTLNTCRALLSFPPSEINYCNLWAPRETAMVDLYNNVRAHTSQQIPG